MAGRKYSLFENSAFLSQQASKEQSQNRFKFIQSIEPLRGLQVRNQIWQKISGSHSKSSAGHLQPLLRPHALFSSSPVCALSQRIIVYVFEPGKKTNDTFDLYLSHFIKYKGTACSVRQALESPWLILIP